MKAILYPRFHKLRSLLASLTLGLLACMSAHAEFPDRSIKIIVPYPPGGTTDLLARSLAPRLSERLRQSVVIENRAGAGGVIGSLVVAKSPADGYTLVFGTIASHAILPILQKPTPYDPVKDFAPVTLVASTPNVLLANPAVPVKSVAELLAMARSKPGTVNFGSTSLGGSPHMSGELLKAAAQIDMLHIPYKGTGPAITDLVGGQVQVMISTFASALPHVKSGRLRALGVTSARRSTATPEVPTLMESGVPDYDYSTWYALFVPARTPRPVIDKLNQATRQTLATADMKQKFDAQGVEAWSNTAAELGAYLRAETEKWGTVVRAAGIPPL